MRVLLGLACAALLLAGAGCERAHEHGVHSERIGSLGHGYRRNSLAVSRDHRHLAWVQMRGSHCRVVTDGRRGPLFAKCGNPMFSPDGTSLAYFAASRDDDPPRVQLVENGVIYPQLTSDQGAVAFAAHGGAWAAIAPERIAPDPTPSPADGAAGAAPPKTKPPRRMIAFDAQRTLGEYADTTRPVVSDDGQHVAYLALDESGRQQLVVDGAVRRTFAQPRVAYLPALKQSTTGPGLDPEATVRFLPDGTLAGVALGEKGWTVFHDDADWAAYPGIRLPPAAGFAVTKSDLLARPATFAGSLVTAAEAPVACWWEKLEGDPERWRVACNGKPVDDVLCSAAAADWPIAVSADGRTTAYVCQITASGTAPQDDGRDLWVVVAGKKSGPYRFVWGVSLSPDGGRSAWAAADTVHDPWFYIVDGRRFDGPWQHAFPPEFAPDGSSVVWGASPDEDGERVDLVQNGKVRARAEIVMAPPLFPGGGRVQWAVKRGNGVRRVIFD